jgi:hypothetical protein
MVRFCLTAKVRAKGSQPNDATLHWERRECAISSPVSCCVISFSCFTEIMGQDIKTVICEIGLTESQGTRFKNIHAGYRGYGTSL